MRISLSFILLGLSLLLSGCQTEEPNKITIGFFGSLTGQDATFGISSKNGITMALEETNQAGGILGKPVVLRYYDTHASAEEAKLSVERLIKVDEVVAVLGEVASTRSLAGAPIAQKFKIPMITPSSTNPEITKKGDYIFRVCFIDPFQGEVMAKFAFNSLKLRKAAILRDTQSEYSMGLANYFITTFTKLGGTIVADENYIGGDVDFLPQLLKISKKNPEFIFVPGYYSEVGSIAKQARNVGLNVPLMGGDGWDSESLFEIAGKSLEGSYFSNHYTLEDPRPEVQNFIQVYERKYGNKPDSQAAAGYDAAMILFEAIRRAGTMQAAGVRDALAKISGHKGVTGTISINKHRDAEKSAVVLQIKNNKFKYVETIEP